MSILSIQFPEDFNKKYKQYRQMLLDIVKEKGAETQESKKEISNNGSNDTDAEIEKIPQPTISTKITFNYTDASLTLNGKFYKPTEETRKKLLQELWKKKQIKNVKEVIVTDGERMRESSLALMAGFINSEQEFNFAENKNTFKETIKQMNRIFKDDKKFPIIIDTDKVGILMIYTES
ncbi:hypothetical protein EXS45_02160 [Candidatus Nomurabacteria bacterium]|nr:hypothetical protein [Candidatus Nomurabacteria bacterium]